MQPEKVTFCKFNRNQTKAIKAKIKPLTDQLKSGVVLRKIF